MKRTPAPTLDSSRLLILVRHGKAAPKDAGLSDFERVLTGTGAGQCDRVASRLSRASTAIGLMVSSPADRALETAHVFAERLNYPCGKIQIADVLYSAGSIRPIVSYVKNFDNSARAVVLVGHNPLLDELAAYFVSGFARSIAKGAVAGISFEVDSWTDAARGAGKLRFFLNPSTRGARVPGPVGKHRA